MATTRITFGRGTATLITRRTRGFDPTEVETLLIVVGDCDGVTFEREWFFDFRYAVMLFGTRRQVTQEEFAALLKAHNVDLDAVEWGLDWKRSQWRPDPMGSLSDYE